MKKSGLILPILLTIIFLLPLAAAQELPSPEEVGKDLASGIAGLVSGAKQLDTDSTVWILIVILITAVLYRPVNNIIGEDRPNTSIFIALVVALLGVKGMSTFAAGSELIEIIFVPYGAMGLTITVFAPIVLTAILLETSTMPVWARKGAWLFLAMTYVYLWIQGYSSFASASWWYFAAASICAGTFFFEEFIYNFILEKRLTGRNPAVIAQVNVLQQELTQAYVNLARAQTQQTRTAAEQEVRRIKTNIRQVLRA